MTSYRWSRFLPRLIAALLLSFLLTEGLSAQSLAEFADSVSIDNLTQHISMLEQPGGHSSRVTFTPGNDSAAAYIVRSMQSIAGLSSVQLDTFFISGQAPYNSKPVVNVIGTLEGLTRPAEVLILGAHYDCSASLVGDATWNAQWYTIRAPGADDNATGVAAILEIARLLSDPSSGYAREITLKFIAFGSEESGPAHDGSHNGSAHYASRAWAAGENIVGMVSIDMIGYNWAHNYTSIVSDANSTWLGDQFRSALFSAGIPLETTPPPYPYATYSDHESFWAQGYPAIFLVEHAPPWNNSTVYSANPYYHRTTDTLETVNVSLVRRVTQGVLAMSAIMGGGLSSVRHDQEDLPLSFELRPTYPNPFNPRTTISFLLPEGAHVDMRVYDNLGREVAILAQRTFPAGEHSLGFDGTGRPSGVYVVRLQAYGSSRTQKMVLVK
jgi:hypothetical protein